MTTTAKVCWSILLIAAVAYFGSLEWRLVRSAPATFMFSTLLLWFALHVSGVILVFTFVASLLNKSNDQLRRMVLDGVNVLSGLAIFQGAAILMKSRFDYVMMEHIVRVGSGIEFI